MRRVHCAITVMASLLWLANASAADAQRRHPPDAGTADAGVADAAPADAAQPATPPVGVAPDSLDQAARLLFESARAAFNSGDYTTALARFRSAYDASARPGLLFNIATTLDRLRQDDEALATFERFLAADPNVSNRAEIDARIRSLRTAIETRDRTLREAREREEQVERERAEREAAERARQRDDDDTQPPPGGDVDSGGGMSPVLFFVAGGLTVVSGGLAVWAGLDTVSLNGDYEDYAASPGATREQAELLYNDASSRQLLTNLFIGGAALFGAAAAVLFFLTDWGSDDDEAAPATATTTPTLSFDANGGVAGFLHRF